MSNTIVPVTNTIWMTKQYGFNSKSVNHKQIRSMEQKAINNANAAVNVTISEEAMELANTTLKGCKV